MRRSQFLFYMVGIALFALLAACPRAHAQTTTSLLDPTRLSVGIRAYRSFDEQPGVAGTYSGAYWLGVPLAWELTSPHDPGVKLPISLVGAIDLGIPSGGQKSVVRGYIGFVALLKKAGQ